MRNYVKHCDLLKYVWVTVYTLDVNCHTRTDNDGSRGYVRWKRRKCVEEDISMQLSRPTLVPQCEIPALV